MLDGCLETEAAGCLARNVPAYMDAARAAPMAEGPQAMLRLQEATFYFDAARLAVGRPEVTAEILKGPGWSSEIAYARDLYLRRRLLEARVQLAQGREAEAGAAADKLLSLVAALRNPEVGGPAVARAVAGAIGVLVEAGQGERAYGLYRASREPLLKLIPPRSVDLVRFRLAEARLLGARHDLAGASNAVAAALSLIEELDLEPETRARLAGEALTLKAATSAAAGDLETAKAALARHPEASGAGSGPSNGAYAAARAAVAVLSGQGDPGLLAAGGRLPAGRWGALDPLIAAVVLGQGEAGVRDPDTAFALFQQATRGASAFDAEAVAALSRAGGELDRRAIHQALRLRARRDRIEREQVQAVLARAAGQPRSAEPLTHDPARRLQLRDFAVRIAAAERTLGVQGLAAAPGATPLKRLQAVLAPDEAALSVAATPTGLAYMCVRRQSVSWRAAATDLRKLKLDGRFVQQALTAGHAADERLDAQFPVEAAGRLYDAYVRPFEACLKPDDRIVWLPGVAGLAAPLAVTLAAPPPKLAGGGYDLAQADWLVRRHAISYAGSPALLVATRTARGPHGGDFDFLGVGDPVLGGQTPAGVRTGDLAPLPETRDELEATARQFRTARLLLGTEATERRLRAQMVGAYSHLSFATHGLIREDLQGLAEPALVLTAVSGDDPLDDGLLTANEIADLTLRARFVALSACNTANFDLDQLAQDLPALSSAFAVAGVPAALATLWPVDSETGKQVVTATFARLRETGLGPAEALAAAQRAFLAAPPGKAWLHPRFWAPFVVLGDGGAIADAVAPAPRVTQVDTLTRAGGEVLGLARVRGDAVAARLISDADAAGRYGAAVRLAAGGREAWRRDRHDLGASRLTMELGGKLVAAGYRAGPDRRYAPVLEAYTPAGEPAGAWQGEAGGGFDAFVIAGAATAPGQAVFAIAERNLRNPETSGDGRLRLFAVDGGLQPRPLADITPPPGAELDEATVTPLGADLLVTYSHRLAPPGDRPQETLDDWQAPLCSGEPVTWLELRDGTTGALKAARTLKGHVVTATLAQGGRVLLGGSTVVACGADARASVLTLGADLVPRPLYDDASFGASEVRALSALAGGQTLVAAHKESLVDFAPPPKAGERLDPYRLRRTDRTFAGMLVTLDRGGRASVPRMLDSGSSVFLSAAETSRPSDLLLGGALGGEAAIFHLTAGR